MSDQDRPGGLTALAVVNFLFGALGLLGTLTPLLPSLVQNVQNVPGVSEQTRADIAALPSLGQGTLLLMAASSGIGGALFTLSGIGYLRQKKFLGRTLGNVCALVTVVTTVWMVVWIPAQVGGG